MEDRPFLIFIFSVFVFLLVPFSVAAYEPRTTHAGLTRDIGELYNFHHPENPFSLDELLLLSQSSIDEDDDLRFMRHFYDPVHNTGLTFLSSLNFGVPWPSAKKWSQAPNLQNPDFTWQKGEVALASGDRKDAVIVLGHILHLIEDMTVPDHTRDDPHPPRLDTSPYEEWSSSLGSVQNGAGVDDLLDKAVFPKKLNSLDAYFDDVASFSNKNFFSKDTASLEYFHAPFTDYYRQEEISPGITSTYAYHTVIDALGRSQDIRIAKVVPFFDFAGVTFGDRYTIVDTDKRIMPDYWRLLSQKAVLSGEAVAQLFFDEAQKDKSIKKSASVLPSPANVPVGAATAQASFSPEKITKSRKDHADQLLPLRPFNTIAGTSFALPIFTDLHVTQRDVESGAPAIHVSEDNLVRGGTTDSLVLDPDTETSTPSSTSSDPLRLPGDNPIPVTVPPSAPRRSPTIIHSFFSGNVVLTREESPYFAPDGLDIGRSAFVTVEPGVVIKFPAGKGVTITSRLVAQGTSDLPIIFTSILDDEAQGDSNGDGLCTDAIHETGAACPVPGGWRSVSFESDPGPSVLDHVIIRYAGTPSEVLADEAGRAALHLLDSSLQFLNSTIEKSPSINVVATNSTATFEGDTFDSGSLPGADDVILEGEAPIFRNNIVKNSRVGLLIRPQSHAVIEGNTFTNNSSAAFRMGSDFRGVIRGNQGSANRVNGIELSIVSGESILAPNPLPYVFKNGGDIEPTAAVTFQAGSVVKIGASPVFVSGSFRTTGSPESRVRITNLEDDSDGNDAFNDGPGSNFLLTGGNLKVVGSGLVDLTGADLLGGVTVQ